MTVAIRLADPRAPEGLRLLGAAHAFMARRYPPEHNHALSADGLAAPHVSFWIAVQGPDPLGCVALARLDGYGEIKSLWVEPAARGRGLARALMAAPEAAARAAGLGWLRLETGGDLGPALRLYRRLGFLPCGPFGAYAEGPHSVFLEKRL
jgi:putative acetyltransferase